ncbi:MAG: nucleotide exchange factor GrpE [Gemmatimonadetes bacterium]|nr:nucleotide exchange factor GrpE [Gemmatimonadota bacterium]
MNPRPNGQRMTDAQIENEQEGREQPAEEPQNVTPDIPEHDDDGNDTEPHVDVAESSELVALRGEFDSLNDRHLRLVAEFNNFRRRSEQERRNVWSKAQADLVEKFLDVLDDLQRVAELDLSSATVDTIMEGVDLVERKFARMLEESGIEVIDPVGDEFDPERMEAMMRVPSDSQQQVGTVAQVLQKGYSLKDVLVRPARVSVFTEG